MKDQNFLLKYQLLDQNIHALHKVIINCKMFQKEKADFPKENLIFKNHH